MEVAAGPGHPGQQKVGQEGMGKQVTQVWGQDEAQSPV